MATLQTFQKIHSQKFYAWYFPLLFENDKLQTLQYISIMN